jgi:hypothetical protein
MAERTADSSGHRLAQALDVRLVTVHAPRGCPAVTKDFPDRLRQSGRQLGDGLYDLRPVIWMLLAPFQFPQHCQREGAFSDTVAEPVQVIGWQVHNSGSTKATEGD